MARPVFLILCLFVAGCDSFTDPSESKLTGEVAGIANGSRYLMHECECTFVVEDLQGKNPRRFSLRFFRPDSLSSVAFSDLRYSNDGKGMLALHSGFDSRGTLVMMRPLGGTPVIISAPDESAVMGDWAPGDSLIAYAAFRDRIQLEGRHSVATLTYRIYDVRTGARRTVVADPPFGNTEFFAYVRFSADSKKIFGAQTLVGSSNVTVHEVDVATGALRINGDVPHLGAVIHIDRTGDRVWIVPNPRPSSPERDPLLRYDLSTKTAFSFGVVGIMEFTNDDQYVAANPPAMARQEWVSLFSTKNGDIVGYVTPGQALHINSTR